MTPDAFAKMLAAAGITYTPTADPPRYLSRPGVAERIGVVRGTLNRYRLPPPDVYIGDLPGWTPATIDAWNRARPSRRTV